MKVCTKCGLEKDLGSFSKNKYFKDGLQYSCRDCNKASNKAWYKENKEEKLANGKKYRDSHKEETAARMRVYCEANKERRAAYGKAWAKANPDKKREAVRKRRAMKELVNENYTKEDEAYTMDLFDNMCYNCDSTDNLHIDHHKPLSRGNPLTRDNAVVLCGSCNSSKGTKSPSEFYSLGDLNLLSAILR